MTPTQQITAKNVIAFALVGFAMSVGVWREVRAQTTPTEVMFLTGVGLLGVWLVASKLVDAYLNKVRDVAPAILAHAGRRVIDPVVVSSDPAGPAGPADGERVAMSDDRTPRNVSWADAIEEKFAPPPPPAPVPYATPTLRLTIPDAAPAAPARRRSRKTDPSPVLVPPTEVQPQADHPMTGVNREDG